MAQWIHQWFINYLQEVKDNIVWLVQELQEKQLDVEKLCKFI